MTEHTHTPAAQRIRRHDGPVVDSIRAMYAELGRRQFDDHLHPDITLWEPDRPGQLFGMRELDVLRAERRASPEFPAELHLVLEDVVVDQWGDHAAVVRYRLIDDADRSLQSRCTDVLTHDADHGWRIVHRHSSPEPEPVDAPAAQP